MSNELKALQAQVAALTAQLAAKSAPQRITYKVSQNGALSVYGLQRFPVTLYRDQWLRLFADADAMHAFMKAHDSEFKTKADKATAAA